MAFPERLLSEITNDSVNSYTESFITVQLIVVLVDPAVIVPMPEQT